MSCVAKVCCACCCLTVLVVIGVGIWGGVTYNYAKKHPPTASLVNPLLDANLDALPPTLSVETLIKIENTLGWPFKAEITEIVARLESLDILDPNGKAYMLGYANVDGDLTIEEHSSNLVHVWSNSTLTPETMPDAVPLVTRFTRDCGILSSNKVTKLQIVVEKLHAKLVFGISVDISSAIPAQEVDVSCDGLVFAAAGPRRRHTARTTHTESTDLSSAITV